MPDNPNNPFQFWQELKRRKVVRVIIVYAAASFVILELASIIEEPFGLPDWTVKLVFVILCVGFIISIILSWIYDVTPEGIEKTKPVKEVKEEVPEKPSGVNTWKIVSIISVVVIFGLVIFNVVSNTERSGDIQKLEKTIAVLPFVNMSSNEEDSYLGGAFTDEIILALQKIKAFDRVLSYTSTMQYEESRPTIPEIAEKLNVNYLIEGSIQRLEARIRVRVTVIRAINEDHIWGDLYEEDYNEPKDILTIQSEIAQSVADELKATITPEEKQMIDKVPTTNQTAYEFYQRGREEGYKYFTDFDLSHVHLSRDYYLNAIEFDPNYSLAFTGLGRAYWMLGHVSPKPSPDHWEESKRLLDRAIELDPQNGWAFAELGVVEHNWDWDSAAARHYFEKALLLSPNDNNCTTHYAVLEYRLGNCSKLASIIEEEKKRNPLSLRLLTCQQDFKAIKQIADNDWNNDTGIGQSFYYYIAYLENGDYSKALRIAESIENKSVDPSVRLSIRGHILAMMGDHEGAMEVLESLDKLSVSRSVSNVYFAIIYDALGDVDRTLEYLERALQERDWRIHAFRDHSAFNLISPHHPWLKDIIARSWIPNSDTEITIP